MITWFKRIGLVLGLMLPAAHAEVVVYPANGQSAEQQSKDEYECYVWAKGKTGFDPAEEKSPAQVQSTESSGKAGRQMLGGALAGAALGEIINDEPVAGAAIGAAGVGVFGDPDNVDWSRRTRFGNTIYPEGLIFVNEDNGDGEVWMNDAFSRARIEGAFDQAPPGIVHIGRQHGGLCCVAVGE